MSQRGKPSTAHEYKNNQCIYCGMYKVNVDKYVHECTAAREKIADAPFKMAHDAAKAARKVQNGK